MRAAGRHARVSARNSARCPAASDCARGRGWRGPHQRPAASSSSRNRPMRGGISMPAEKLSAGQRRALRQSRRASQAIARRTIQRPTFRSSCHRARANARADERFGACWDRRRQSAGFSTVLPVFQAESVAIQCLLFRRMSPKPLAERTFSICLPSGTRRARSRGRSRRLPAGRRPATRGRGNARGAQ